MNFFGVGPGEAFLVVIIALLVVGPNRFPEVARQAARYYKLARRYTDEVMKDVRAAVDDLEQEVGAQGDDLRAIREIGTGLTSDLRRTSQELSDVGRDTQTALESTAADARAGVEDPAPSASVDTTPPTPDAAATTDGSDTNGVVADEETAAVTPPLAEEPREPRSVRPSKRLQEKQQSADPFAALEAKRARDRERETTEHPSPNGHQ